MENKKKAEKVIALIGEDALSMKKACDAVGISVWSFLRAIEKHDLTQDYARARDARADIMFDQMLEIADEKQGVIVDDDGNERLDSGFQQRQKQRIDALKWTLSRMNPKKYGDKIETTLHTGKSLPDWMNEGDE